MENNEQDFDTNDLELLKKQFDEVEKIVRTRDSKMIELQAQIAEIAKQWQAMSHEKVSLERELNADRQTLRNLEKSISSAQRLALVKEEQARLREEFESKAKELDSLTATAKWREFAFDHQIEGAKRLAVANRAILGDKRGLGKTLTSLIFTDMVSDRYGNHPAKRVLVLAPNDVVPQFEDEIRSWAPGRTIFSLRGMPKSQRDLVYPMLNMVDEFIITLNYEAWRRDKTIIDDLVRAGIDTIVCDEAHRIKASDKVTARGVFQLAYRPNWCPNCDSVDNFMGPWLQANGKLKDIYPERFICCEVCGVELVSTVKNVLCMTGTPILNKPQELFSLLYMVDRFKFPSESKFLQDYCYNYGPNRWTFMQGGLARLTRFMSEFFIQRTREDTGIKVPPPQITTHLLEKDKVNYAKQYEAEKLLTEKASLMMEDKKVDFFYILEMILRERQIMTWPKFNVNIKDPETQEVVEVIKFDIGESQKLDAAMELLNDLMEEGERVIIFSQFKAPLYEMHQRCIDLGYKSTMATGDQTDIHKRGVQQDFDLKTASKDNYKYQVAFATYKAFGTGINLNAARHMILLDDEWNPGMEDQAIGRIDRMNSVDQANVHIFRVKNSVDDFMAGILEEKRKITSGFNESVSMQEMMNFFKR